MGNHKGEYYNRVSFDDDDDEMTPAVFASTINLCILSFFIQMND